MTYSTSLLLDTLRQTWKNNSFLGVKPEAPYQERRRQMMTNHINMALIVMSAILLVVDSTDKINRDAFFYSDDPQHEYGLGYRFILAIILAIINLGLSATTWNRLVRWMMVFAISYLYVILPLQIGPVYDELYLWYPYVGIPFVVIPAIVLDYQKDKLVYVLSILYCFLFPLFSEELLNFFAGGPLQIQDLIEIHALFYRVAPTTITAFIFITVVYLLELNDRNAEKVETRNQRLSRTILQLKDTQDQLIKNEKMAVVGRMSSELTHEINTPITAIKANLNLIAFDQQHRLILLKKIGLTLGTEELDQLDKIVQYIYDQMNNKEISKASLVSDEKETREKLEKLGLTKPLIDDWINLFVDVNLPEPERFRSLMLSSVSSEVADFLNTEFQQQYSFAISQKAIGQAERLLNKLKSYAYSRDAGAMMPFSLAAVVYNSVDLMESQMKSVSCQLDIEPSLPQIHGQSDEIMQVVNNLLVNALQAMNYHGELFISLKKEQSHLVLQIEDTGGGIHLDNQEDIFRAFFTTKAQGDGSGLGLNISKQIVEKHKGTIDWVNTEKGARFTVKFPV